MNLKNVKKTKNKNSDRFVQKSRSETLEDLYQATIIHEKPLANALGENFKDILTKEKVIDIFKKCNFPKALGNL